MHLLLPFSNSQLLCSRKPTSLCGIDAIFSLFIYGLFFLSLETHMYLCINDRVECHGKREFTLDAAETLLTS